MLHVILLLLFCGHTQVQTDNEPEKPQPLCVDNTVELQDFMKRVEPIMVKQLQLNMESHAFDG